MEEIWKDIRGYEGLYSISNLARVRSNSVQGVKKEIILKYSLNKNGYNSVSLWKNNKPTRVLVHRVLMIHFVENLENKPCVNHINGIKHDNRLENLEWCTYKENNYHAINSLGSSFLQCNKGKIPINAKKYTDLDTGIEYKSIESACRALNLGRKKLLNKENMKLRNIPIGTHWNANRVPQNAKKIIDTNTGVVYNSLNELSNILGIKYHTIRRDLNGDKKNKKLWHLKYVEEQ